MKKKFTIAAMLLAAVLCWNCGGKSDKTEEESYSRLDALKEFTEKAEELQKKEAVDPVDFRELKELLPETAAGIARTDAGGEKNGAMGFTISQASGTYRNDDASLKIDLMDLGGISGMGSMSFAAWALADLDKETSDGYEKTLKIGGHKAFEKYNNNQKEGELKLFVADRFVVNLEGRNLSMEQIKKVLQEIDLSRLEKLK